jgi:hypothetical protein
MLHRRRKAPSGRTRPGGARIPKFYARRITTHLLDLIYTIPMAPIISASHCPLDSLKELCSAPLIFRMDIAALVDASNELRYAPLML